LDGEALLEGVAVTLGDSEVLGDTDCEGLPVGVPVTVGDCVRLGVRD
jgi:hypothetical protein